jgi:iron complex transport system ATP-binding protein
VLSAAGLSLSRGGQPLLADLDLELRPGHLLAIVGPNGAGKTTLLRLLAGDVQPDSGTITLDGVALHRWSRLALARRRSVMTQQDHLVFALRTAEVVGLGRFPWAPEPSAALDRHVAEALESFDAAGLATRDYSTLSGGERARVRLARALVQVLGQAGPLILLDEPLAHLDFAFQHVCLQQLRRLCRAGTGIAVVMHDPNLALHYAESSLLLDRGRRVAMGPSAEVLTAAHLERVYGRRVSHLRDPRGGTFFTLEEGEPG